MTTATAMTSSLLRNELDAGLASLGLPLQEGQREQLLRYVALLDKWNKVYNLTAIREPARMLGLHILDSLAVHAHLPRQARIIDIGTGAGLPGIPLAVARPDLHVAMLDTIAKKTTFVRQAASELGLGNAEVITARVESYVPERKFDFVISRAFAELKDFVEGGAHLCAPSGRLLAMKGVHPHDEIARLPAGFAVEEVIPLHIPAVEGQRHLVVIRKNQADQ